MFAENYLQLKIYYRLKSIRQMIDFKPQFKLTHEFFFSNVTVGITTASLLNKISCEEQQATLNKATLCILLFKYTSTMRILNAFRRSKNRSIYSV